MLNFKYDEIPVNIGILSVKKTMEVYVVHVEITI